MTVPGRWRIGLVLVLVATGVRVLWALSVPTIPVGDFATYRESAMQLVEHGSFDRGFVYMPGLVILLGVLHLLGGEVLAAKLLGALLGGLAVAPLYFCTARLIDNGRTGEAGQPAGGVSGVAGSDGFVKAAASAPVALVAGLGYALWPAGIALSSVIGTDIPTATMILFALAILTAGSDRRPRLAAAGFGAAMGVAAYFRAVALPLSVFSVGYWLLRRTDARQAIVRTTIAVAVTVALLLPWGLRNKAQNGELFLTDSHGGITLLMGNDPNTEGTYSRALGARFEELTGRTFLSEPHRQTDRLAYALARQWMAFDVGWTAGMVAMRAERLFAPERGLLYWPIYRPGVLPPAAAAWFNQHRGLVTGVADLFYLLLIATVAAGIAFAVAERRPMVLAPVPFAVALAATYILFVAEPRYRLTTEILLFPVAAFGAVRLVSSFRRAGSAFHLLAGKAGDGAAGSTSADGSTAPAPLAVEPMSRDERRGLAGTAMALAALAALSWLVVRGGAALREGHRWAAAVCHVDGRPQMALWRRLSKDGASPVRGTPDGAALLLPAGRGEVAAEIVLPNVVVGHGPIQVDGVLDWRAGGAAGLLTVGTAAADSRSAVIHGVFDHRGGAVIIPARLQRSTGDRRALSVEIAGLVLKTASGNREDFDNPESPAGRERPESPAPPGPVRIPAGPRGPRGKEDG